MNFADSDKTHGWHPFTAMREWCAAEHEPLVIVSGEGAMLRDERGREYVDGNSSIWTNLHGHRHPRINAAIRDQLDRVAHTSFLGATHGPGARLAEELVGLFPAGTLTRVFFSDDGSTAIEVALKMAAQYWQLRDEPRRKLVAFHNAYHGDTMGASSLGGVPLFHGRFAAWHFPVTHVGSVEELEGMDEVAAVVIEPIVQGVAGMRAWPRGMLAELRMWCDESGALLIADEILTGFGRTGTMFACEQEKVTPDFMALAKGLTGGYLPLAATLTTDRVFETFLGHTFFYGHSYTANQLGCAAALANLAIFREENVLERLQPKIVLKGELLAGLENVAGVRQTGFIGAVDLDGQNGVDVCLAARRHGLLTRPIRDTVVLMPPYCITDGQLRGAVEGLQRAISETRRA